MQQPYFYNNFNNNYQRPQDERIWVQNETSAEAYLIAPNGYVRLWDSQRPVFYEKRADATGRPLPMEVYEYKKIENTPEPQSNDVLLKLTSLEERITALEGKKERTFYAGTESDGNDAEV